MNDFQKYLSLQLQKADRELHEAQQSVTSCQRELQSNEESLKNAQEHLNYAKSMAENHRRVYEAEMRRDPMTNEKQQ